jgi:transposase
LVDQIPPVRGKRGRPRRRPRKLLGDRAYWSHRYHRELRRRKIKPKIAPPKSPHGSGLGKERWVVERSLSWLHQKRKLRIRYERRDDLHAALLRIGCVLICASLLEAGRSF